MEGLKVGWNPRRVEWWRRADRDARIPPRVRVARRWWNPCHRRLGSDLALRERGSTGRVRDLPHQQLVQVHLASCRYRLEAGDLRAGSPRLIHFTWDGMGFQPLADKPVYLGLRPGLG